MQEEIFFQGENKKTLIKYFTTFTGQTSGDDSIFYVITDSNDNVIKLVESEVDTEFSLNSSNYNIPLSAITNGYKIYTGTVIQNEVFNILSNDEKNFISEDYLSKISYQALNASSGSTLNNPFSYVFFDELLYNDYFLNVKINRSVEVLNTLNIYNVPINESQKFSNDTGVLYGKIDALQVILDDQGNKFKIPIKNASIAIFNPSDEFPSIGSVDDEGNRIRMNLFENMRQENGTNFLKSYGSFQSYLTDLNNSPRDYQNFKIPPKYKYTSLTNENGEFILYNVPTGQQTLMLEVDLLKQGLEPEEVALNFFPYPTVDEPNVSNIPHLYFNQFPVNILPSWGEFQTGYTEINLTVTLDLRKWITYFTYPISSKIGNPQNLSNQTNESSPKVLEELFLAGSNNPFTVLIRDMTKPFVNINNPPKIELVKVIDIYDKNLDLKCGWNQEYKTRANKIEFNTTNYNAFKLPANLYDPIGFDTNGNKGVWLGAYQIKTTYPSSDISYQATGYAEEWPSDPDGNTLYFKANHYDLNRYDNWNLAETSPEPGKGVGKFPYEKPWSLTYPESYKITKKPSVLNPLKSWDQGNNPQFVTNITNQNGVVNTFTLTSGEFFLQPRYLDGDMAGGTDAWATNANGYGLQSYGGIYYGNNFSREVTKNEIWKYEATDHWNQEWSNGYKPALESVNYDKYPDSRYGKPSIFGERWQRLEAGYAYWLKPRGWPRIQNEKWGDHLLDNDYNPFADHNYDSVYQSPTHYNSYFPSIYNYLDEITLQMGAKANFFSKYGRLEIYRVEKPYYTNEKKPPFTEKFAKFNFQRIILDQSKSSDEDKWKCKAARECNSGGAGDKANCFIWLERGGYAGDPSKSSVQNCDTQFTPLNSRIEIALKNIGTTKVYINGNEAKPSGNWNDRVNLNLTDEFEITLPANDKYNPRTNSYEGASYIFYMGATVIPRGFYTYGGIVQPIYRYAVGLEDQPVEYYLTSLVPREVGVGSSKCAAVKDFNNAAGISPRDLIKEVVEAVAVVYIGLEILAFTFFTLPVGVAIGAALAPRFLPVIWNEIRDVVRLFDDPGQYNSTYRNNNRIGVFINGMGYYVPREGVNGCGNAEGCKCWNYSLEYLDKRGPLPYIGPEVEDAAKLDIKNYVPYHGNYWYTDYRNTLGRGAAMMAFQPKKIIENNMKGTLNQGYFMEVFIDNLKLDYSKGF